MAFKPIDPKRDDFRRYLERSGVIEALTKVFVKIVKDRPDNPLDFLRHNLGDALHQADSMAYLQSELQEARGEIERLRGLIESIDPDALREQNLPEDMEKKTDETTENQEKCSEEKTKLQEESQPVKASDELEAVAREDSPAQNNTSPDNDIVKNLETPEDSTTANNSNKLTAVQTDNN
ncbi:PREDICTED: C-Myc-binding protein homolog [Bactrocera latifrons]|uniref:c-Myc-binding n=1 Tax=Bactrocera latifrons TaxID=174628 RepID=A0A0K8VAN3_BACLA|nr:PREDICTED: C-Myc-binding protein homolog [Bactrocera latifrons]